VHAYLIAPPARSEMLLDVERRLRSKLADAARAIGRGLDVVPRLTAQPHAASADVGHAALRGEIAERIARWHRVPRIRAKAQGRIVGAVHSPVVGWLAALDDARLVASLNDAPPDPLASVAEAVRLAEGPPRLPRADELELAASRCERWIADEMLARHCGIGTVCALGIALDQRIARAIECAPRHRRALIAEQASRLLMSLDAPQSLGVERALRRLLVDADGARAADWLSEALTLVARNARERPAPRDAPRIAAMVLFGP
jgi:hypothetical protein